MVDNDKVVAANKQLLQARQADVKAGKVKKGAKKSGKTTKVKVRRTPAPAKKAPNGVPPKAFRVVGNVDLAGDSTKRNTGDLKADAVKAGSDLEFGEAEKVGETLGNPEPLKAEAVKSERKTHIENLVASPKSSNGPLAYAFSY